MQRWGGNWGGLGWLQVACERAQICKTSHPQGKRKPKAEQSLFTFTKA
uniref:Uncharacterized protein n=1 Tax=Anguilla anguilla TaxID=7936 RepID=A0A0E9R6M1_ANGAN